MNNYTITTRRFDQLSTIEFYRIAQLREEVFHLEQRITDRDMDDRDQLSTFMWIEVGGSVVALLRILPAGVSFESPAIGRLAVRKDFRRQGLARRVMIAAIEHIREVWAPQKITIEAQKYLVEFYRTLGFEVTSEEFYDAGIAHHQMTLHMDHTR